MDTTTPDPTTRRAPRRRIAKALAGLTIGITFVSGATATANASDWQIVVPDRGYTSCNWTQNTLAMTAHAAPNGNGQYLSARFQYLDQTTGRRSTSNWTGAVFARPTGGTTQIGYWTVNGVAGHSYQTWVQVARWNGSRWTYDSWVPALHQINITATHTNAYGQAIGNLGSYAYGNCVIQ